MKTTAATNPTRGNEAPSFRNALNDLWRVLTADMFKTYQPEKHYMRGPGPKWHERHARGEVLDPHAILLDEFYSAV